MATLEKLLNDLLSDTSALSQAIEADPQFKSSDSVNPKPNSKLLEEVLREDSDLTKDLAKYNQYKILSNLIKEFNTNYELNELENCYYSLQNIHKKFKDVNISGESFRFQQSVATYIDCLHLNVLERFKEVSNMFYTISGNEMMFKKTIELDSVEFNFDEMVELFENNFFDHNMIDQTHWFIASTNLETYKDKEILLLQEILDDTVKLNPLIKFFKEFVFDEKCIMLRAEPGKLTLATSEYNSLDQIKSYQTLSTFIEKDLGKHAKESVMIHFGNVLLTELLKIIRENPELLSNDKEQTTEIISSIHDSLTKISEETEWAYDGCELNRILKDENIYTTLKFESMMQQRIIQIRSIPEEEYHELVSVQFKTDSGKDEKGEKQDLELSEKKTENGKDNESWGWNENQDSDEHDGWDEELEIDVDNVPIQVSVFVQSAAKIFTEFEQGCDTIGRSKVESIYLYKFNLLQTAFFAMISEKVNDWTQLYKDVRYLYTENPKLLQLMELNSRRLDLNLNLIKKTIYKLVNDQLQELKDNERTPDWDITISSLLPYLKNTALPTLYKLEDNTILVALIRYIVHDLVIDNILHWRVISEKSSENLSEFIILILSGLEIPRLNLIETYRHSREKLGILSKILTAHLKDILEMFYEGEFFLFETDEIVQWIILLFADTPTRRDCIDEIRRVREEATD